MKRSWKAGLLASALVLTPVPVLVAGSAQAQDIEVSFDSFHDRLANYGEWVYSDRWGEVWVPDDVDADWAPYTVGHWVYTDDYGWMWVSDEGRWGDIVYHYGRWVNDPDDGWMWIPGYIWSPAWVVWRSSGDRMGWMPMPPDERFLGGSSVSLSLSFGDWGDTGDYYGYSRWYGGDFGANRFDAMWTFVPLGHMGDRDYRRYAARGPQTATYINNSRNVTNYAVVNNIVVNRSVNVDAVQHAGGHFQRVANARQVMREPNLITHADVGLQVQAQRRQADPRGNGQVNSAPPPNAQQVKALSTRPVQRNGRPLPHLFNQSNAVKTFHPAGASPLDNAGHAAGLGPDGNQSGSPAVNPGGPMRHEERGILNGSGAGRNSAPTAQQGGPATGGQLDHEQLQQQHQELQQQNLQERRDDLIQQHQRDMQQLQERRGEELQQHQQEMHQHLQDMQQQHQDMQQQAPQAEHPQGPSSEIREQHAPAPTPPVLHAPPPSPDRHAPPPDDKHRQDNGG